MHVTSTVAKWSLRTNNNKTMILIRAQPHLATDRKWIYFKPPAKNRVERPAGTLLLWTVFLKMVHKKKTLKNDNRGKSHRIKL